MPDFIKRNQQAQPYYAKAPKITDEYVAGVNDLFFNYAAPFDPYSYHAAILLGSPLLIKDMARTARDLTHYNHISPIVMSGGASPAYEKFGVEFIGCALYEIFNGTFDINLKRPESVRAYKKLFEMLGQDRPRPQNIALEGGSKNTYKNLENSWMILNGASKNGVNSIAIYGASETLPRAIETFKTITDAKIEVRGVPYRLTDAYKWTSSPIMQSRIAAEVRRLSTYSDKNVKHIEKHIDLTEEKREKLKRVLVEIDRQQTMQ